MRICPSYGAGRCVRKLLWVENNNTVKYFLPNTTLCFLILGFSRVPKHLSPPPPRSSSPLLSFPDLRGFDSSLCAVLPYTVSGPLWRRQKHGRLPLPERSAPVCFLLSFLGILFPDVRSYPALHCGAAAPRGRRLLRHSRSRLPFLYIAFSSDKHCIYFFYTLYDLGF